MAFLILYSYEIQLQAQLGYTTTSESTIMLYVAMLRLLAIGLLSGVITVPLLWLQQGDGFEYARLAALMAFVLGQFLTVPVGLVVGWVLAATGSWTRTPGYVLGAITTVFGAIVATQAWATMNWVDGGSARLGDSDVESLTMFLASFSGGVTTLVGVAIVSFRWAGYDPQAAPVRQRGPRRYGRARRRPLSHVKGHSP
ncbi:hypothetical protein E1292_17000 [Nonomuraea deserti]|uniref:Uncharacterized protein n=1 Tax=Nonomuraea deserti TaxID=1848322 RepID=A0A4R4VIR4_9ACTN|nr:hypothetical protein [Nonomuraea deserti]TDD05568.1 hypothetical protein E1292_17000 [Nonomuraea deserti]